MDFIKVDPAEWRAWIALHRLSLWKWHCKSRRPSQSYKEFENSLAHLFEIIEQKNDFISGGLELVGILSRVVETGKLEDDVKRLFNILDKIPDKLLSHRMLLGRFIEGPEQKAIEKLLEIAMASDEPCLRGFLKSFPLLVENMVMITSRPVIEILRLTFDPIRIMSILGNSEGLVREGAILLLAHNNSISFEDTKCLLELSRKDSDLIDRSWAELIRGTVRDSDTQEAIDFLERILSARDKYPKAVKYAALEKYQRIAKSSTIDIKEQEKDLGLPFQTNT